MPWSKTFDICKLSSDLVLLQQHYLEIIVSEEVCTEERREAEKQRQTALEEEQWQERERIAQEAFRKMREAEEKIIKEREEREVRVLWCSYL